MMTDPFSTPRLPVEDLTPPEVSKCDQAFSAEREDVHKLQFMLSNKKEQWMKVKGQIQRCQALLEQQDERLKSLQEQIAISKHNRKGKQFNWTSVKAAHLISKVFEKCGVVTGIATKPKRSDEIDAISNDRIIDKSSHQTNHIEAENGNVSKFGSPKSSYTIDFHRFVIALYFFSPTIYIFLSNLIPMFPHQNYIRQWVTAGRLEKLFPQGVFRDEFNEQ